MESFQTFITESLDKPYPFEFVKDESFTRRDFLNRVNDGGDPIGMVYEFHFESKSGYFIVSFKQEREYSLVWECMFESIYEDDKGEEVSTMGITGESKEDAMRIFSTIIKIIKGFVEDLGEGFTRLAGLLTTDKIMYVEFRIKEDEPSRVKLYKRIFDRTNIKGFEKEFPNKAYGGYYTIELKRIKEKSLPKKETKEKKKEVSKEKEKEKND